MTQAHIVKVRLKIENLSMDPLLFKPKETSFEFPFGNYASKGKPKIIEPGDKKNILLEAIDESKDFMTNKFSFSLGGIYLVNDKEIFETENFKIPKEVNTFTTGLFSAELKGKIKKTTDHCVSKFKMTYTGSKLGVIQPIRAKALTEMGREFVNTDNARTQYLLPGDQQVITVHYQIPIQVVDMQFANLEIVWNDTFMEYTLEKQQLTTFTVQFDHLN